jgi:hypothetical protein
MHPTLQLHAARCTMQSSAQPLLKKPVSVQYRENTGNAGPRLKRMHLGEQSNTTIAGENSRLASRGRSTIASSDAVPPSTGQKFGEMDAEKRPTLGRVQNENEPVARLKNPSHA